MLINVTNKVIMKDETTIKEVLEILYALRNEDEFYFNKYGEAWIKKLIAQEKKNISVEK